MKCAGEGFCIMVDVLVVGICGYLGDLRPSYAVQSWWTYDGRLSTCLRLAAQGSKIFLPALAIKIGHFDTSYDCDKNIRQNGASSADSIDCDCAVVSHKLARFPCALSIGTHRVVSPFNLVCHPLLEDDIAMILTRFQFC